MLIRIVLRRVLLVSAFLLLWFFERRYAVSSFCLGCIIFFSTLCTTAPTQHLRPPGCAVVACNSFPDRLRIILTRWSCFRSLVKPVLHARYALLYLNTERIGRPLLIHWQHMGVTVTSFCLKQQTPACWSYSPLAVQVLVLHMLASCCVKLSNSRSARSYE